jgi:hypothetical protein
MRTKIPGGIRLQKAIYALFLMQPPSVALGEMQAIFMSPMDQYQAVETLTKTIRLFDSGIYTITKRYQELAAQAG